MENQSSETAVTEEGRISIYVGMKEEADRRGISYAQICRDKGMSPSTFYHGMSRHGMGVSKVKGCEKSEVSARRIVPDPVRTDGVAVSLVISGHEVTVRSSKAEFKEPYFYNSLLSAIASGSSTLNEIATKVQEDTSKVGKYLESLRKVHIVERILPYGEKEKSRKGIYTICDNYFAFWFHYIFGHEGQIQFMGPQAYANKILETLDIFLGHVFEKTCEQYIQKLAQKGKLPFVPNGIGRWWGNNPIKKKQDDVDILGRDGKRGLFVECKFRNEPFDLKDFQNLLDASKIFTDIEEKYYLVIVKSSYTDAVKKEASHYSTRLLTIENLFQI